jgi:glycosyltransferase involved in cell wall biosynthesis
MRLPLVILFIHQNFPAQFRHIAEWLGANTDHKVIGLGDVKNIPKGYSPKGVTVLGYATPNGAGENTHHYIKGHEEDIRRGQQVVRAAQSLQKKGIQPDVVVAHSGWGEALFLKPVFPDAKHLHYCEFYYHATGSDVDFDAEFPSHPDSPFRTLCRNTTQLLSLTQADAAISPTQWQKSLYPTEFHNKIQVLHEGVNTQLMRPNPQASFTWQNRIYTRQDKVLTYISRNLEPYRGFHSFMRSLPAIQARHPDAAIFVVGGDEVSYGSRLANGEKFRERYIKELGDRVNWDNVHFTGKLPYGQYRSVLQISSTHVYLTYPFVLSWSLVEAMSVGCTLVTSNTSPLQEVIEDNVNGLMVDFFDTDNIANTVCRVLDAPEQFQHLGKAAREKAVSEFDLDTVTLPKWMDFVLG